MKQSWVVAALIIFALSFSVFYPNLGWILRGTFFRTDTYNDDYQKLMREKEALEADLATRIPIPGTVEANTSSNTSKPVSAFVFSRYPFNFKNELLAAAGSEDGVHVGDTALVPIATGNIASSSTSFPGVLLGKVKQV
jgi:cell shape-determining protein MreC